MLFVIIFLITPSPFILPEKYSLSSSANVTRFPVNNCTFLSSSSPNSSVDFCVFFLFYDGNKEKKNKLIWMLESLKKFIVIDSETHLPNTSLISLSTRRASRFTTCWRSALAVTLMTCWMRQKRTTSLQLICGEDENGDDAMVDSGLETTVGKFLRFWVVVKIDLDFDVCFKGFRKLFLEAFKNC